MTKILVLPQPPPLKTHLADPDVALPTPLCGRTVTLPHLAAFPVEDLHDDRLITLQVCDHCRWQLEEKGGGGG